MKKHPIKCILIFTFILFQAAGIGQVIHFNYDDTGNRLSRELIYFKDSQEALQPDAAEQISTFKLGDLAVKVYPNPGNGVFFLEVESGDLRIPEAYVLTVTNLDGELVFRKANIGSKDKSGYQRLS